MDMPNAQREALLGERWRALSDAEKATYKIVGGTHASGPYAHPAPCVPACTHAESSGAASGMPSAAPPTAAPLTTLPTLPQIGTLLSWNSNTGHLPQPAPFPPPPAPLVPFVPLAPSNPPAPPAPAAPAGAPNEESAGTSQHQLLRTLEQMTGDDALDMLELVNRSGSFSEVVGARGAS